MLSSLFASLFAKIAGAVVVALAATGALAAAGALPAPAQQAVANVASTVGIHLPSGHAAPTATVGDENAAVTATMTGTTSTVTGTTSTVTSTATTVVNHGNCVSYAASIADSLGMTGSLKGSFLSGVAQDSSAVSAPVPANGTPDAHCETAILKAKAAATSPGQSGATHGVTTTGTSHNPTGYGSTNHPSSTSNPGSTSKPSSTSTPSSTSNPGTSSIPTGVVPSHPTGR